MNSQRRRANYAAVAVSGELLRLFTELSYVVSEHGITPKVLGSLLERSFARATAEQSRLRNGRANNSRVAARTGLSRSSIKWLLDDDTLNADLAECAPVAKVVNAWRADRQFLDSSGNPRVLKIQGKSDSFARLAKKYGGDIPPRAILDELRRRNFVTNDDASGRLRLKRDASFTRELRDLKICIREIADYMRSLRRNLES